MTRRVFVDTEWTALPWSGEAELMWIGLADEHGHAWHAISADIDLDPHTNDFISGAWNYISPDDPRSTTAEIAQGIVEFCADVDEFWAWIPNLQSFSEWFELGEEGADIYSRYWNWDLQMLQATVDPWPSHWPTTLHDLTAAAVAANVENPPRQPNHLAPDVHAVWNAELYRLIREADA